MTFPDVTSNRDPCHGHWMTEPCKRPWHNGPPKWVQVLSRQYTLPPTLNNANGRWFAVTHIAPPSGTSLSGRELLVLQLRIRGHPARGITRRKLKHRKVERVEPGEGDELEPIAQVPQFALELREARRIQFFPPVE